MGLASRPATENQERPGEDGHGGPVRIPHTQPVAPLSNTPLLRWTLAHAREYGFDPTKIVTAGGSNGGYLALMAGILAVSAGLDRHCPSASEPRVAAIIHWFGHVDLTARLGGPEALGGINMYIGSRSDRAEMATRVSPITCIRRGIPPVFVTHGDADEVIPFQQSVALVDALKRVGAAYEFVPLPGAKHGFQTNAEQSALVWSKVFAFLRARGQMPVAARSDEVVPRNPPIGRFGVITLHWPCERD